MHKDRGSESDRRKTFSWLDSDWNNLTELKYKNLRMFSMRSNQNEKLLDYGSSLFFTFISFKSWGYKGSSVVAFLSVWENLWNCERSVSNQQYNAEQLLLNTFNASNWFVVVMWSIFIYNYADVTDSSIFFFNNNFRVVDHKTVYESVKSDMIIFFLIIQKKTKNTMK